MSNFEEGDVLEIVEGLLKYCETLENEIARLTGNRVRFKSDGAKPGDGEKRTYHVTEEQIVDPLRPRHGIIIADDCEVMRRLLVRMLTTNGFEVVGEAVTGEQAVQMYHDKLPTIITMDIDMPDMDGVEAIRHIKKYDPEAKVVVLSGVLDRKTAFEAINAGAVDCLAKPVAIDRLLPLLEKLGLTSTVVKNPVSRPRR